MLQTLLAALIVLVAFIFVMLPLFTKKKSSSSCDTCASGACGGCALHDVAQTHAAAQNGSKKVK